MRLEISEEAQRDLRAIAAYIEADNPQRAITFVRELVARCHRLVDDGHRFPFLHGREASGIRRCLHKPYLIFYRVLRDRIDIVHIIHGARDYERILFAEGD